MTLIDWLLSFILSPSQMEMRRLERLVRLLGRDTEKLRKDLRR